LFLIFRVDLDATDHCLYLKDNSMKATKQYIFSGILIVSTIVMLVGFLFITRDERMDKRHYSRKIPRPNFHREEAWLKFFLENFRLHPFNEELTNEVEDVFVLPLDQMRQRKAWIVCRSTDVDQYYKDYPFLVFSSPDAIAFLCSAPTNVSNDVDQLRSDEIRFFIIYCSSEYVLGFNIATQDYMAQMPIWPMSPLHHRSDAKDEVLDNE